MEDLQGNIGLFFIFPDVSIRFRGRFQLGITAVNIFKSYSSGGIGLAALLATTRTNAFDVLPRSEYKAVGLTPLTQDFLRQGAPIFPLL